MDRTNSTRFLSAYNEIDAYLMKRTGMGHHDNFPGLLKKAVRVSGAVKHNFDQLLVFNKLRNAIVHESTGNRTIAEPHLKIVEEIERIRDQILKPPLSNQFLRGVTGCSPQDLIGEVAQEMLDSSFSQTPIYDDGGFRGLLTTDTIARWITTKLNVEGGVVEQATVEEVMPYAEFTDNVKLIGRNISLYDIIDYFEQAYIRGKRLDAIIISNSGTPNETALGIITVFDLPEIYEMVRGTSPSN